MSQNMYFVRILFLCGIFLPGAMFAQSTPQPTQAGAGSGAATAGNPHVEDISLDLVVRDPKHRQVLDLKEDDLEIKDNDQRVKVTGLHLIHGDSGKGALVTLLFDHFEGAEAKNAKSAADKVVKTLAGKDVNFAVLDTSGRLRLLQVYTAERAAVDRAIDLLLSKPEAERSREAGEAEKRMVSVARSGADLAGRHVAIEERAHTQILLAAMLDSQRILQDQHGRQNLSSLLALVRAQEKAHERRAIVYFTRNAVLDSSAREMVHSISAAATRAGVLIYTVDLDAMNASGVNDVNKAMTQSVASSQGASGIHGPTTSGAFGSNTGASWGQAQDVSVASDFMRRSNEYSMFANLKSPMGELATNSGGLYIDAQSNMSRPLQQMHEDLTTWYQVTYASPLQEYTGELRSISIHPRSRDLRVQAKTGYYAVASESDGEVRPFETPLLKVLGAEKLPGELNFSARVLRFGELPDGNMNTLVVEVPLAEVQLNKDPHDNLYAAHLAIVARIRDEAGTVVEHFGEDINRRGALESMDRDKTESVVLQRHFVAVPGKYTLEVAVGDQISGRVSAQRVAWEVSKGTSAPALSDFVLVRKMAAFHPEEDPLEPMQYDKARVTPNLLGWLPADTKGTSIFFILHPDASAREDAKLEMEIIHNGHAVRRVPLPLQLNGNGSATPYLANFGGKGLAAGAYTVKAYFTQAGRTAESEISFAVAEAAAATSGGDGQPTEADLKSMAEAEKYTAGLLAISASTNPLPSPSPEEVKQLLDDARERAMHYIETLPNFFCIEATSRSFDHSGNGHWKLHDTLTELLTYKDKHEEHKTIQINGQASNFDRADVTAGALKSAAISAGELGGVFRAVFDPRSQTEFQWKETDSLRDGTVQVFTYKVDKANSQFSVTGANNRQILVAFHGQVYIDSTTHSVRRLTMIADGIPVDFPTHSTSIGVDYDYIAINDRDYLLPISAELRLTQGKHESILNAIEFRDYHRFGSTAKIFMDPASEPK